MKKLLAMVLALVMTLSLAVSANAAFEDAKDINATYAEAVDVLAGMKVFQGYDNGKTFKPQGDITRAEVAAIVYRIYTADVKDSYVKNYETYNKFSDMAGAGWAKGYIGYCANAALVKGYPNGTFQPSGKVTGYEVLAMILRAVGYDKNNEFTGADWALHVAQIAEQNKILKNVKGIDLSAPASRELVAELLFQAIQVPTVTYTAAFGYQDISLTADKKTDKLVKANSSLGYKNFKLVSGDGADAWGRPTTVWAKDANGNGEYDAKDTTEYATIVATPDASFNVATTQCDICEALKEKKSATIVDTYTNGVLDTKDATYSATETKKTVGAQGEQIEFYQNADGDYRLVVIDTYLAKVNDVVTEKTDSKGHVTRDAYLELRVFDTATSSEKTGYTTQYVKGNDYAEGDYVLVNVNKNTDNNVKIILTTNAAASSKALVEVVGKADSFEGAQTSIWSKTYKHTIDKKDYLDASEFNLDEAGTTGTAKYTWFLDQFGNLIGSVGIANENYAVLKSIIWKNGEDDHAEATLVYMDGTEDKVTVDTIDGLDGTNGFEVAARSTYGFGALVNDSTTVQGDTHSDVKIDGTKAYVSTSASANEKYRGLALYLVETNKDGSVNLQGVETTKKNDQTVVDADNVYVEYADGVTINAKSNVIKINSSTKYAVSNSTKFIVRTNEGTTANPEYKYEPYTLQNLPEYKDGSVEAFFVVGANKYVSYVYIKNATDAASMSKYVFVPNATDSNIEYNVEDNYFAVKLIIDGEEQMVETNATIAATLAENEGKLFEASWGTGKVGEGNYGELVAAKLVNEATDNEFQANGTVADYVYRGVRDGDYLRSYSSKVDGSLENHWLLTDAKIYDADGKEISLSELDTTKGLWIISDKTDYEGKAKFVYVGEELSADTRLTVYDASDDTKTVSFKEDGGDMKAEIKLAVNETAASYKYVANNENVNINKESVDTAGWLFKQYDDVTTVIIGKNTDKNVKYYVGNFKSDSAITANEQGNIEKTIKVVAENGVDYTNYVLTVTKNSAWTACTETEKAGQYWNGTTHEIYVPANSNTTLSQFFTAHNADSMTFTYDGHSYEFLETQDQYKDTKVVDAKVSNVVFTRGGEQWTVVDKMD